MSTIKERYAPQIDFNPYLTYPIKTDFQISEGFVYTKEERDISGNYFHKGIDFACPYGTPIYAAASGYTVASYFRFTNFNKRLRTPRLYKNKPLGNGMGYFIQIYHPEEICGIKGGRITQYGHLSKFADGIYTRKLKWDHRNWEERVRRHNKKLKKKKLSEKELEEKIKEIKRLIRKYPWVKKQYGFNYEDDINKKEAYLWTPKELKGLYENGSKYVTWVNQGDLIGYVGTSGILHGKLHYRENVTKPNVKPFDIWDETHLHFVEANRDWETGRKIEIRDPFDLYLSKEHYKAPFKKNLFIDDDQGRLW
jgi:murein DD-endopeptidase MepM/ murein hydrolase activator NlpD